MKKLVMYSDQIPPLADQIDKELLSLIAKPNPVVGYIPSKADPERSYYKARQDYYSRLGMDLRVYFELDNEYQPNLLDLLLSCDAIHLSGGNTYYFLYWLRRRRLIEPLRQYVEKGGVLVGVSAGSMLMSQDISICPLWVNEPIEIETEFVSLGLVDFAFVPHWGSEKTPIPISVIQNYSREHCIAVYICKDSGGIIVDDNDIRCIGDVFRIDER